MKTKYLLSLAFTFALSCTAANAYTERNLLQKHAATENLKSSLVLNRQWVKYPSYNDREGWNKFFGEYKDDIIKGGEKFLDYQWQVVEASDYLEFERSGNRRIMEDPLGSNNKAITQLLLAELAEGKGRFMDKLINGVFHSCEMTSWALSAHLGAQPTHRSLPSSKYDIIDLTAGDMGNMLSWTYYFMHEEFDKVDPEISRRLYSELNKRIMTPYLENDSFWWLAWNYKGQW